MAHNEGTYLRYETWIREQESARGLLAMASGSLFAMRRASFAPLDRTLGDDFALPLHIASSGLRCVLEPRAVAVTRLTQADACSMFRMKVRIIAKDLRALLAHPELLNPLKHFGMATALWSHKMLRWFVPYFLVLLFISNLALLHSASMGTFLACQIFFYLFAATGISSQTIGDLRFLSVPASFCVVNAAALFGTLKCILGGTFGKWTPKRAPSTALESRDART